MIDEKWFKQQQRKMGVTATDIASKIGRDRTAVSHIYMGRQRMSLDWAKAFAEVLQQPLDEILRRAGVTDDATAQSLSPGFSESDATPWVSQEADRRHVEEVALLFGKRPGVDVWSVRTGAMHLQGLLPGDYMLVDTNVAERVVAGDIVIAQVYDNSKGKAATVLRRYEPPVLVAASIDPEDMRVLVVDEINVAIRGKILASWRTMGKKYA